MADIDTEGTPEARKKLRLIELLSATPEYRKQLAQLKVAKSLKARAETLKKSKKVQSSAEAAGVPRGSIGGSSPTDQF